MNPHGIVAVLQPGIGLREPRVRQLGSVAKPLNALVFANMDISVSLGFWDVRCKDRPRSRSSSSKMLLSLSVPRPLHQARERAAHVAGQLEEG